MEDDHVAIVINDALAVAVEIADEMDIGAFCAGAIKPGVSERDGTIAFGLFFLDEENLWRNSH